MVFYVCFTFLLFITALFAQSDWTPLDDYVRRPDNNYQYRLMDQLVEDTYICYYINMTSQQWMDETETTTPVWTHHLILIFPNDINRELDTGLLYIGSGRQTSGLPDPETDAKLSQVSHFAVRSRTVGALLRQIPNQPLHFVKDDTIRREDDAIALTWRRFIEDKNNTDFLMRMPMTKAAVRAMDTITSFARDIGVTVNRFMVAGASKRGWTTWTTAAVDPVPGRVFAIAPKVLSCLNMQENLHHHYRALGGWTFAFFDYYNENITQYLPTEHVQDLANIVDPFTYRARLTLPKFIIGGVSDEFFLPDDSHYFYDQLVGPKYFWLVENTGHSMTGSPRFDDIWDSMRNFYLHVANERPMPQISWQRNETDTHGSITLWADQTPVEIVGWVADSISTERRDFRLSAGFPPLPTLIEWNNVTIQSQGENTYYLEVEKPQEGWRGMIIEVQFASMSGSGEGDRITLSSEINIIPDTFPFQRCTTPEQCWGELV